MPMTDEQIAALVTESTAALETKLTKSTNDGINGALARFQKEVLPAALKEAGKATEDSLALVLTNLTALQEGKGGDKGDKGGKKDEVSPEIKSQLLDLAKENKRLADEMKAEKDLRAAAEKTSRLKDKEGQVRKALSEFEFASPEAAEDAFTLVSGKADFDDNGQLLADGLPFADFAKAYIPEKKAHLLKATGRAGAGSSAGSGKSGAAKINLDDIKPGMKADAMQATAGEIARVLRGG